MAKIDIRKVSLATFLKSGLLGIGAERYVTGHVLLERAENCLQGEATAREVQRQLNLNKDGGLSAEARKQDVYLCIPEKPNANLPNGGVWCLCWHGDEWCLDRVSLDVYFHDYDRLLRPRG